MVTLKLNGERTQCPSCYEEIKTRHYLPFQKVCSQADDVADLDFFQLFNVFTDKTFTDYTRTVENEIALNNVLSWVITQDFKFSTILPKVLVFKGHTIPIPQEIGELSIGQNIHLRRDYIDRSKILEENLSIAASIYLQPIIDNKQFSLKRAIEIAKEFDEMPAYLIYPIGFFLLRRALSFGLRPAKTSPLPRISLRPMLSAMSHAWRRFTS